MRTRDEREGQKRNPDTNFNNQDGILIHHYKKLVSAAFTHKRTHSSAVGPTHPARKPTGGPKVCYGVTASRFHPSDFARDPPKSNLSAETNPGESTRRPMPVPFPVVLALSERRHWPAAPHPKGRCTASHPQRSTLVGTNALWGVSATTFPFVVQICWATTLYYVAALLSFRSCVEVPQLQQGVRFARRRCWLHGPSVPNAPSSWGLFVLL